MDLSLVVPSFKQAITIRRDLRQLTSVFDTLHIDYEIILVVDGDVDGTTQLVEQAKDLQHIRIETLPDNRGKGFALRHGLSKASGTIVGFMDAGGEIDCTCLPLMIDLMSFSNADIVIGSKRHPLSVVQYPVVRRIYSLVYQAINQMLFRLHIRDTQVGVKLFRKEVIEAILPHIRINRFAFDLEVLVLARLFEYRRIIESPVKIQHAFRSTISIFSVVQTLHDTVQLYFRERKTLRTPLSSGIAVSILSPGTHVQHPKQARETVR